MNAEDARQIDFIIERLTNQPARQYSFDTGDTLRMIFRRVTALFAAEEMLHRINAPVTIMGDTHGQLADLQKLLKTVPPPEECSILFLGDYVDRGALAIELMILLFAMKIKYPKSVHLLRGNHEFDRVNRSNDFYSQVTSRPPTSYGGIKPMNMYQLFQEAFAYMPFCALVNNKILCMHGGFGPQLETLDQINKIKRPFYALAPDIETFEQDLLWADPCEKHGNGFHPNERGCSYCFGADVTEKICHKLSIDMLVRGHSYAHNGYAVQHNKKCITVFSAPNYCGSCGNPAAFLSVDAKLHCRITTMTVLIDDNFNSQVLWTPSPVALGIAQSIVSEKAKQ